MAAPLQERITASRQAITALNDSIRAKKIAEAEEEISQGNLRRQYENNYLDARKNLGRETAEMLFPKASGKKITAENEE